MDIKAAAFSTRLLLLNYPEVDNIDCDKIHLNYMLVSIFEGTITGDKAHRWLGYVQGVLVSNDQATVKDFKEINKNA